MPDRITLRILIILLIVSAAPALAAPPGTGFTYQGKLTDALGTPLSGTYDMAFALFDDPAEGKPVVEPVQLPGVPVSGGLFTVKLDFGADPFTGAPLWLETRVGAQILSPRTELTAVPTALHALTVPDAAITTAKLASSSVTAAKIAAGQVVKSINNLKDNVTLSAGAGMSITPSGNTLTLSTTAAAGWNLTGNSGTTPGTHFLGTTDTQPLELRVNGKRALRLEPFLHTVNIIGGHYANIATEGVYGATIGGGGTTGVINQVTDRYGTIAGGIGNQAGDNAGTSSDRDGATVGGGMTNTARGKVSTISGGSNNTAAGEGSSIIGGEGNYASGSFSTVAGGCQNSATGDYSLAAGRGANAGHTGSFVFADSTEASFASTADDQFLIRASGNVGINNTDPRATLTVGQNITGVYPAVSSITLGSTGSATLLMGKDSSNSLSFGWNDSSGYAYLYALGYKPLVLQRYSGNLGIGTDAPQKKLSVSLGMNIDQNNGGSGTLDNGLTFGSNSGEGIASKRTSGGNQYGLDFYANYIARMSVTSDGSVGIGTQAPEEKLSVAGSIKVDQGDSNNGTFASGGVIKFGAGLTGEGIGSKRTAGGNWAGIDFYTGSNIRMTVANGGNVGIGTTAPAYKLDVNGTIRGSNVSTSDLRLKTNIAPLEDPLGSVLRLRGVSFDWKDESLASGRQIGVIAQEVEAVFPELVSIDGEGYRSVAYDKLVPVLIEAVKEQQAKIEARDARISDLEARLARIESLLDDRR